MGWIKQEVGFPTDFTENQWSVLLGNMLCPPVAGAIWCSVLKADKRALPLEPPWLSAFDATAGLPWRSVFDAKAGPP